VLYPQLAAHASGYLKVSDLHTLYYEVYGNPKGIPAVVVHGGPGAGCWPNHARFFDPAHYRIILVDQRGCGRSTPYGCLAGNITADLVSDLEQLRKALGVHQWLMLGGSWGVTLTLAFAQVRLATATALVHIRAPATAAPLVHIMAQCSATAPLHIRAPATAAPLVHIMAQCSATAPLSSLYNLLHQCSSRQAPL
jgi:pimeloyl-ACP methyl ester carboxylesterase